MIEQLHLLDFRLSSSEEYLRCAFFVFDMNFLLLILHSIKDMISFLFIQYIYIYISFNLGAGLGTYC